MIVTADESGDSVANFNNFNIWLKEQCRLFQKRARAHTHPQKAPSNENVIISVGKKNAHTQCH